MKITVRHDHGIGIGILIAVLLFLIALFLIVYLLVALLRIPPRNFPDAIAPEWYEYLYEPVTMDLNAPAPPAGTQYRKAPLLASTNLVNWETIYCDVDAAGYIHWTDGSIFQLQGEWSEGLQEWTSLWLAQVRAGTNAAMFFRLP